MSSPKITHDKVFHNVQVTHSLVLPLLKKNTLDTQSFPERTLLFDEEKNLLILKTKCGWKHYCPVGYNLSTYNPSAPPLDQDSFIKANLNKDCLEVNIIGYVDEDNILIKIQEYLEEYKGRIKKIQIKDAKDKLSKDFQKLLERLVKKSKIHNNGITELDL